MEKKSLNRQHKKIEPEKLRAYVEKHPDAYQIEMAEKFNCSVTAIQKELKRLRITRTKDNEIQRTGSRKSKILSGTNKGDTCGEYCVY